MCTIGIIYRVHRDFPMIIAANRDEFYARGARSPERFAGPVVAVGGVDMVSGGTWLGVTAAGRIVAVTNQRAAAPPDPLARSRGLAVREALLADDVDAYVAALDPANYSSMNLLFGDAHSLSVAYFRRGDASQPPSREIVPLAPGVHVLCNGRIGCVDFPRGDRLARVLTAAAHQPWPTARAAIAAMLADHEHSPPDPPAAMTAEQAIAWATSAVCIHSPTYGTRSSAIVALTESGVHSYEHTEGPSCVNPWRDYTHLLR